MVYDRAISYTNLNLALTKSNSLLLISRIAGEDSAKLYSA